MPFSHKQQEKTWKKWSVNQIDIPETHTGAFAPAVVCHDVEDFNRARDAFKAFHVFPGVSLANLEVEPRKRRAGRKAAISEHDHQARIIWSLATGGTSLEKIGSMASVLSFGIIKDISAKTGVRLLISGALCHLISFSRMHSTLQDVYVMLDGSSKATSGRNFEKVKIGGFKRDGSRLR